MIGRAGRPQFETEGKAVIMTRTAKQQDYLELAGGTQLVESHLASAMVGHVNAEIALGTITDIPTVLSWLKFSFLWVRIRKSPQHYGIAAVDSASTQRLEDRLQEMVLEDIRKLTDLKAITLSDDMLLRPTHAGKQMAKWCIAYETFQILHEGLQRPEHLSTGDLILLIAQAKEYADVVLRSNEKTPLKALNKPKKKDGRKPVRYPIKGTAFGLFL